MTAARKLMNVTEYHQKMVDILAEIGEDNLTAELSKEDGSKNAMVNLKKAIEIGIKFESTSALGTFGLLPRMNNLSNYKQAFLKSFAVTGPATQKLAEKLIELSNEAWPSQGKGCAADLNGNAVFKFAFEHNRPRNSAGTKYERETLGEKLQAYTAASNVSTAQLK